MKAPLIALLMLLLSAQDISTHQLILVGERKRIAEMQVARAFDNARNSIKAPVLKRVPASLVEAQLVCTAATTGKEVRDPRWGGLATYVTDDPSSSDLILKSPIFMDNSKGWSRYSVVVDLDLTSSLQNVRYRVGIAIRSSRLSEFTAPLAYDNPMRDSNDWKEQIAFGCKDVKP